MKNKINYKKGQVVLVVLLVTSAVMVMGLSLSRGSVKELKIDTNEETLKQTFNTAESGLDYFLIGQGDSYKSDDEKFEAMVREEELRIGKNMESRKVVFYEPQFLKLDGYDGNLTIKLEDNFDAAVKVDVFYSRAKIERYGYNFNDCNFGDNCINGFDKSEGEIKINIGSGSDFLVVTPLFRPTRVEFSDGSFANQGRKIISTANSQDGVESRVSVDEVFEIPYFMLEGIVAEGDVLVTGN